MGFWRILCKRSAKHFPIRLTADGATGRDVTGHLPRRWLVLAILLLICLIPRVWAAWKWDILWADSISYLQDASALARGDLEYPFRYRGLNIYPVILMGLQRTGWDVLVTGECWSVMMGTLAVLPLFGWVRRQFNDQVATVACLLYAFQPKLVAFCPMIIRDVTFWFLLNLSIYLFWRAITEGRWWLFLTAGIALTLSVHTRTEGWLLLAPFVWWCAVRVVAVRESRMRMVLGTTMCLLMIPASVTLVNLTWLRDCPHWEMIRSDHRKPICRWLQSLRPSGEAGEAPHADSRVKRGLRRARPSSLSLIRKAGTRLVKAYTYVYGLLALIGVGVWRRVWIRREHQALALLGLLLVMAVYIDYAQGEIDIRYFLPLVLVSFPWMALGLLSIVNWLTGVSGRQIAWSSNRRGALLVSLLVVIAILSTFDAKASASPYMRQQAVLGKWIVTRFGGGKAIGGRLDDMRILLYYAQGHPCGGITLSHLANGSAVSIVRAHRPDVIVIGDRRKNEDDWIAFQNALVQESELRYYRVPADQLPSECREMIVLVSDTGDP